MGVKGREGSDSVPSHERKDVTVKVGKTDGIQLSPGPRRPQVLNTRDYILRFSIKHMNYSWK